ncbi:MAG: OmpA family protein [Alphaproteobacteria bacterium]|nr:OmpA family protein [Alphaproteobacteria bacterium]
MRCAIAGAGSRGRGASSAGDSGDYFASMTDLMLGLIFVFVIMLMSFALNLREAEHKMSNATEQLTDSDLARRELLHDLADRLQRILPVTVDEQNGTLQLGGDVLFPKGSADAYPEALPKLRMLAQALDAVLPCYAVAGDDRPLGRCAGKRKGRLDAVYIEGHTDTAPIRTPRFQSNWELSAARASETFARLVDAYPTLGKLQNDRAERLIGVSGYGEYRPVDPSPTEDARQRNRRIELRFIMAAPRHPELDAVIDQIDSGRSR